jgi:signal transduction histidine kinase
VKFRAPGRSLLGKALLIAAGILLGVFATTGWLVQRHAAATASAGIEEEMRAGLRASESLWTSRSETLRSISLLLSTMSDVRAAFSTGDAVTIEDYAGEMWRRVSPSGAFLLVTDPLGRVIASTGGAPPVPSPLEIVAQASDRFPAQVSGFWLDGGTLHQAVLTPVFVHSGRGTALLNVLVAGYTTDTMLLQRLQSAASGSQFVITSRRQVIASTLPAGFDPTPLFDGSGLDTAQLELANERYAARSISLRGIDESPLGRLWILRSFGDAEAHLASLRRDLMLIWACVGFAALGITFVTVRPIVGRIRRLNAAAAAVAANNYTHRLHVDSRDELGRLTQTFNDMCASLEQARGELIRQERLTTVTRLATSLVHDLRNPLAAIYGGAEMLVDDELPPNQTKRLAGNIYKSSKQVQRMLHDLLEVTAGSTSKPEVCSLHDVVAAAAECVSTAVEDRSIKLQNNVPGEMELPLERARMERVFLNLFSNAIEAMPNGGSIKVTAERNSKNAVVTVEDDGPGVSAGAREHLFQPFATSGKRNGLGLGLALSRQTVRDHGGELWEEPCDGRGACFRLRLPLS